MKHAILFIALSLQIGLASEAESWTEWVAKGHALARAGTPAGAIEAFARASALAIPGSNITEWQYLGILNALALVCVDSGQYTQAEQQWRRAAGFVEKAEGADSLDYALLVANMVGLPTYRGNLGEAKVVLRKAIARNGSSASSRDLAFLRGNLARLLILEKQYADAETLLQDSLTGLKHDTGGEPKQRASLLSSLGFIRYEQGRFAESADLYREEVRSLEVAPGSKHFYLVAPLNNLANGLVKLGRGQEAVAVYKRAVPICDETAGKDQKPCGLLFEDYATVLRALGGKEEAKRMAARGREIAKSADRQNGIGFTVDVSALVAH